MTAGSNPVSVTLAALHKQVQAMTPALRDAAAACDAVAGAPALQSAFQSLAEAGFHLSVLTVTARAGAPVNLTPGRYLALRRRAAGRTVADVAARLASEPRSSELDRVDYIRAIEGDVVSPTIITLAALREIYPFDMAIIARLALGPGEAAGPLPPICRACGCSDFDACVDALGHGCAWAEPDLCSACADGPSDAAA